LKVAVKVNALGNDAIVLALLYFWLRRKACHNLTAVFSVAKKVNERVTSS